MHGERGGGVREGGLPQLSGCRGGSHVGKQVDGAGSTQSCYGKKGGGYLHQICKAD